MHAAPFLRQHRPWPGTYDTYRKMLSSRFLSFETSKFRSPINILARQLRFVRPDLLLQPGHQRHIIAKATEKRHGGMRMRIYETRGSGLCAFRLSPGPLVPGDPPRSVRISFSQYKHRLQRHPAKHLLSIGSYKLGFHVLYPFIPDTIQQTGKLVPPDSSESTTFLYLDNA